MGNSVRFSAMPLSSPDELNDEQMHLLRTLVGIPSWYRTQPEKGRQPCNEHAILEAIEEMLRGTGCALTHVPIPHDPHRHTLVAEKGDRRGVPIMLYGHVDTVVPADIAWENPYTLRQDGDKLAGLGAYDMKAGVMAIIDILRTFQVPKGVRLVGVFAPDEEENSRGVQALLDPACPWKGMEDVQLVLSPEIVTIRKRAEIDEPRKDIITGRMGHLKTELNLTVPQEHAFTKAPRATGECNAVISALHREFEAPPQSPSKVRAYFGSLPEVFEPRELHIPRADGLSVTTSAHVKLRHLLLPPRTIETALTAQIACVQRVSEQRAWAKKGVTCTLQRSVAETSYDPYTVDMSHPLAVAVSSSIQSAYGDVKYKGGASTSDANVFAAYFASQGRNVPVLDLGPIGGKAHHREEWVSQRSIARHIAWMRKFLSEDLLHALAQE